MVGRNWRVKRQFWGRWQKRLSTRYGPWALVTGASSGIGREMVLRLAEAGINLVLIARSQTVLEQMTVALTSQHGIEVRVFVLDLSLEAGVETLVAATQDLDIGLLVAAPGFGTSGLFLNSLLEQEMEMLNVNCRSLLGLIWHFGQRFAMRGRGGMVLMSSIVGFQGMPFAAHYAATKAYVQALAEALYVELAPMGIDVLAAAPGPTHSGFATRAGMQMGMALKPEDIALPILNALGRRSMSLPGVLSKLLTYSLVPLPRWARVRIMGEVMGSMTKHQRGMIADLAEVE
ncbi:SDR family NAD(P)-dependent oxidoreductase [Leptolyngbya sp. FACHB-321]|uniref:SDR family NAD(P)-dependent oxidoreductase n=1 Tax=Leptolyngbya sp. FACHB-321 TaxID=2692807 RepID=UPI001681FD21|nr:SDR family NAD(P)-dependent oxidoreductase [Leptolyngbya sp. FACHB-321]MBD2038571.1 SDR family NAD(P)-dependent oxidoreductase [Leptolyngbya sp. FACHB-321]